MCCAFNVEKAEKIYRNTKHTNMISKMQSQDMTLSNAEVPGWFEPISHDGVSKGLTLLLDAHTDMLSPGTVIDDFQGSEN